MGTTLDSSTRTDEAIRADVLFELEWDPKITSPDIAVAVANGVVTLSVYVPINWEKQVVQASAKHVFGVRGVANVTVQAGRVTLEGAVDWQYQKDLAESAVRKLKGVIGVTNPIEVKPFVCPVEIKTKIEDALKRSAELDARRIPSNWKAERSSCPGPSGKPPSASPVPRPETVQVENHITSAP